MVGLSMINFSIINISFKYAIEQLIIKQAITSMKHIDDSQPINKSINKNIRNQIQTHPQGSRFEAPLEV